MYGLHPSGEDPGLLADFVAQTGISFPVMSGQNTRMRFAYPPGVQYPYPRDVVIGKDLTIRSIKNSFNIDDLDALVQTLLAE